MKHTEYLNTDLDLVSDEDLTPLAKWFGRRTFVLHNGTRNDYYVLSLETHFVRGEPDDCALEFVRLVKLLPAPLRKLWDGCRSRTFDIGIESGTSSGTFVRGFSAATVEAIASVGGDVKVTVYTYASESSLPEPFLSCMRDSRRR